MASPGRNPGPRAERYWRLALERSAAAEAQGALVPLATECLHDEGWRPFTVRRLLGSAPKHLRESGPKPNPFLPWDPPLAVEEVGRDHLLLLNKYPVQRGHLLLITQRWQPQHGWLEPADWCALATVASDTGGLWFFNSCAAAGASQPHRHLQLLPRHSHETTCPLAPALLAQLGANERPWPWRYCLSRRDHGTAKELERLYRDHLADLDLGSPEQDPSPRDPYNLLLDDDWLLTVRRRRDDWAGFSINALGFAGYLLLTESSDLGWLQRHSPWQLLRAVATP